MAAWIKYIKLLCMIVILFFGFAFFLFGFLSNWETLDTLLEQPAWLMFLIGVIITIAAWLLARLKVSPRLFVALMLLTAFLIRLFWIILVPTEPESDFALLYEAAVSAANNDYSFTEDSYFIKWVYQLGFVMYEAAVVKLFGDSIFILKFLNVLYSTAIVWFIYQTARHFFNETAGRLAGLAYTIYIPAIVMNSVLTNQVLATVLFYAGIYLLVTGFTEKKYTWLAIGLLFAFGNIIRPLGSFVLLAAALYIFVVYMLGKQRKTIFLQAGKFAGLAVTYLLTVTLCSQIFMAAGISEHPLENRDPLWKFVLGLNHETTGQYSHEDSERLNGLDLEERLEKEEEMIQERLEDKSELLVLFKEKFKLMWGERDASITWSQHPAVSIETVKALYQVEKVMFTLFFFFGIFSIIGLAKDAWITPDSTRLKALFFVLFIIGYAMIHLIIEIQTRYRFVLIPSLVIVQSCGIYYMLEFLFGRFRKKNA